MTRWLGKSMGLALGGGGVRGFSHIGVLKVLEEANIPIDVIAGSSAGALIGGAYASGSSPDEIHARVDAYIESPAFKSSALQSIGLTMNPSERTWGEKIQKALRQRYYLLRSLFKPSILPIADFEALVNYFLPDMDIKDTRIPFRAVATDLITGKKIVIAEGSLRKAVLASCAVPGAIDPVRLGAWLLADGGITSLVPVLAARQAGADVVIAVVVTRNNPPVQWWSTAQEIFYRAGEITSDELEEAELQHADVVIRPSVGDLHWADFKRGKGLIGEGELATRAALPQIEGAIPVYKKALRMLRRWRPTKR
jgi:NTE family protein